MKKIILSGLIASSLLQAEQSALSQEQKITDTKAQIKALQANLKKLEESLPISIEKDTLKTHTEFGFIQTTGNTDTTTYNLDLNMKKSWDKHVFELSFDGQYADDNGVETKNKYLTELEYDYEFTDRFAFDYLIGFKQDKFSGYNYQAYTGPGIKYKAIKEEKQQLSIKGNILYSKDEIQSPTATRNYTSFRAKGAYKWQIFDNLKFAQDLSYRVEAEDTKNYFMFSKTALTSKLSDIFSFGISYKVDYVNLIPQATEHSDKTLTANLIVDY